MGICLLLLITGCSREQQDWRVAEASDTIEAYGQFLEHHPESELTRQARTRIAQLGEDRDWQHAGSADTVDAYREFLGQHPNGKWAQEARIRIENFSLSEQGAAAAPGVAPSPVSNPAAPGDFGIQLGAFSSEAGAASQWRSLLGRFRPELQGLQERIMPADTPSGHVYRLQASVGTEARARAICDSLQRQAQGCVAVLPH